MTERAEAQASRSLYSVIDCLNFDKEGLAHLLSNRSVGSVKVLVSVATLLDVGSFASGNIQVIRIER